MAKVDGFVHFPKETLKFLRALRKDNTKSWFDKHRSDYDDFFVAPAKEFVEEVEQRLKRIAPKIVAEPRINGSIFRINRDIRFSKDKRPYKDHLDFGFWEGDRKSSGSSMFLRVSPDAVYVGAGFHQGCPTQLKAFRATLADEDCGRTLASAVKKVRKTGVEVQGQHYKRVPKGLPVGGPAEEFYLHNAMYVVHEHKPSLSHDKSLLDTCLDHWLDALPLHRWLVDNLA